MTGIRSRLDADFKWRAASASKVQIYLMCFQSVVVIFGSRTQSLDFSNGGSLHLAFLRHLVLGGYIRRHDA